MRRALLACAASFVGCGAAAADPLITRIAEHYSRDAAAPPGGVVTPDPGRRCPAAPKPDKLGVSTIALVGENDMFNGTNDRNYTSGIQATWLQPLQLPNCLSTLFNKLTPSADLQSWDYSLSATNMMFTPTDLARTPPDPHDRPYAGVTAATLSAFTYNQVFHTFDEVGVSLGAMGPDSHSDDLQRWWHKSVLHVAVPQGWNYQIPNALLAELTYQHTQLFPLPRHYGPVEIDGYGNYGFGAGTFMTYAHAGVGARAGINIDDDAGPPRIAPSMQGNGFWRPNPYGPYLGGYVFLGTDERYVGSDHVLDTKPSNTDGFIDHVNWINDTQWGWVAHVGGLRFTGVYVWRGRQFRGQSEGDSFGSYSVTFSLCLSCYAFRTPAGARRPWLFAH
ncbi:MAG: lipid A deacylase LpxR family protein [Alphaproteobacteria bacterium]